MSDDAEKEVARIQAELDKFKPLDEALAREAAGEPSQRPDQESDIDDDPGMAALKEAISRRAAELLAANPSLAKPHPDGGFLFSQASLMAMHEIMIQPLMDKMPVIRRVRRYGAGGRGRTGTHSGGRF